MSYSYDDIAMKSVAELRKLAAAENVGTSKWRTFAPKEQLIAALTGDMSLSEVNAINSNDDAAAMLTAAIQKLTSSGGVNEDKVREVAKAEVKAEMSATVKKVEQTIDEKIAALRLPISVEIKRLNGTTHTIENQHNQFPKLLKSCAARVNVWLVGPAGSGKTTAAENVAKELELPFFFNGAIDSEHKLLGFVDANGRINSRPFRKAFSEGGVYLFDEVDASMPSALLAFNAALANGHCDFPDACVAKHKDFVCIAAGNVFDGATSEYVGRFKQDKAFLDRFITCKWPYDESLETQIAKNPRFTAYVQGCRERARQHGLRVVISPRASLFGGSLLEAGLTWDETVEMTLRKGLDDAAWNKIKGNVQGNGGE